MNNTELETKILEIINTENYFDMVIKAKNFDSEYKKSDFYKQTKKPLNEVIKETKLYYAVQLRDLGKNIQKIIDGLSLENFDQLLDKINEVFGQENKEILESLEVLKDLKD